jgi:hypothetical protein
MALEVEQAAMAFAEAERARQLGRLGGEARTVGVPLGAQPGERSRRMLALAGRVGLGSKTAAITSRGLARC